MAIQENNGLIEGVKRSVITALNAALDEAYADPSDVVRRVVGNIEMEDPLERVKYPGIWVQFSFTEVRRAAIAEMHYREETLPSGEPFLSLIHISEPTRRHHVSRMPSSA